MPVLFILAVLWAVVLVPPFLRSRSQHTADSIVDFNYKLDVLGRTNGHLEIENVSSGVTAPPSPERFLLPAIQASAAQRSARRRRDVLRGLTGAVTVSLLLAAATHAPIAWGVQILVDGLGATYLALWAWLRTLEVERTAKVRYMPEPRRPDLALRRSASS